MHLLIGGIEPSFAGKRVLAVARELIFPATPHAVFDARISRCRGDAVSLYGYDSRGLRGIFMIVSVFLIYWEKKTKKFLIILQK